MPGFRVFYGWVVVAAAAIGLFLGAFPIVVFSFSVFFPSYTREFHSGRAAISLAFMLHNLAAALLAGCIGRLADRFGARKVILPGLAIVGLILLSAGTIGTHIWQLYVFYTALGVVGGATNSVPYGLVVSRWFDAGRGLALGVMMIGLGAGTIIMPALVQRLIADYGWRAAFAVVGCAILMIPIPIVARYLEEDPRRRGLMPDGGSGEIVAAYTPEGATWKQIRTGRRFWVMIAAFVLVAASVHGCIIHLPQILAGSGADRDTAALGVSVLGIAVLAGRIGTGYFLDRYFGPYVALIVFASSAVGIALLLWARHTNAIALLSAFLVGLGFEAEVDVIAYLMGRYFGLRALGVAFGFGFGAFVLAGGLGPLIMGYVFDKTGSYRGTLTGFFVATLAAAAMVGTLGPYNFGVKDDFEADRLPIQPLPK